MRLDIKNRTTYKYSQHFKGKKRYCHISGRTGYEDEMVKINGKWILKDWVDKDELGDTSNLRR